MRKILALAMLAGCAGHAEYQRGMELLEQERYGDSAGFYGRALERNPDFRDDEEFMAGYNRSNALYYCEGGKVARDKKDWWNALDNFRASLGYENIPGCGDQVDPMRVEWHNERGRSFFGRGEFENAVREFSEVLGIDNANGEARIGLADARVSLGEKHSGVKEWPDAIVDFEAALEIDPTLTDARSGLGVSYYNNGMEALENNELETAVASLGQAMNFQHPNAQGALADVFGRMCLESHRNGNYPDALDRCEKSLMLDPDDGEVKAARDSSEIEVRLAEGTRLEGEKQWGAAAEEYRSALLVGKDLRVAKRLKHCEVQLRLAGAHYTRSKRLLEQKRFKDALVALDRAVGLYPGIDSESLGERIRETASGEFSSRGEQALGRGDIPGAEGYFRTSLQYRADRRATEGMGRCRSERGKSMERAGRIGAALLGYLQMYELTGDGLADVERIAGMIEDSAEVGVLVVSRDPRHAGELIAMAEPAMAYKHYADHYRDSWTRAKREKRTGNYREALSYIDSAIEALTQLQTLAPRAGRERNMERIKDNLWKLRSFKERWGSESPRDTGATDPLRESVTGFVPSLIQDSGFTLFISEDDARSGSRRPDYFVRVTFSDERIELERGIRNRKVEYACSSETFINPNYVAASGRVQWLRQQLEAKREQMAREETDNEYLRGQCEQQSTGLAQQAQQMGQCLGAAAGNIGSAAMVFEIAGLERDLQQAEHDLATIPEVRRVPVMCPHTFQEIRVRKSLETRASVDIKGYGRESVFQVSHFVSSEDIGIENPNPEAGIAHDPLEVKTDDQLREDGRMAALAEIPHQLYPALGHLEVERHVGAARASERKNAADCVESVVRAVFIDSDAEGVGCVPHDQLELLRRYRKGEFEVPLG